MQITLAELIGIIEGLLRSDTVFRLTFSDPKQKRNEALRKLQVRAYMSGTTVKWSMAAWDGRQERHQQLSEEDLLSDGWWQGWLARFKQLLINTSEVDYHLFNNRDGSLRLLKKPASQDIRLEAHDRQKKYLLPEGEPVPFLVELGVMTSSGKVVKAHYDKFRQINRFLEFIEDVMQYMPTDRPVKVVDFGCGRSYLTFAVHWLLQVRHGRQVDIIGLDLKEDVILECNALAEKLGMEGLIFAVGDIAAWQADGSIDMVISLHACDTATDAALAQAVRWQSKVILAAPCCQHQLAPQLASSQQATMLQHGILRERLGALVTDSLRAQALEALGWTCQILEFIDLEHTPKNLLLRAVGGYRMENPAAADKYNVLRESWGIREFALEHFLDPERRHFLLGRN